MIYMWAFSCLTHTVKDQEIVKVTLNRNLIFIMMPTSWQCFSLHWTWNSIFIFNLLLLCIGIMYWCIVQASIAVFLSLYQLDHRWPCPYWTHLVYSCPNDPWTHPQCSVIVTAHIYTEMVKSTILHFFLHHQTLW